MLLSIGIHRVLPDPWVRTDFSHPNLSFIIRKLVRLLRKSRTLTCLAYVANDWHQGRKLARGEIGTTSGMRTTLSAEAVIEHGEPCFVPVPPVCRYP